MRMNPLMRRLALVLFVMLTAASPVSADQDPAAGAMKARLDALETAGVLEIGGARITARDILSAVYEKRGFRPMWTDSGRVQELLALIAAAPADGLDSADYFLTELQAQVAKAEASGAPPDQADLDILLTESLLRFGYHQLFGKVNPAALDSDINFTRKFLGDREPEVAIPEIIASPVPLQQQLDDSVHRSPVYRTLQRHLADYRRINDAGGWPRVAAGETLRKGDNDPRVVTLRERLIVTGDLPAGSDTRSPIFDEALEAAVIGFQARHALAADGVVGKQSYEAMNVPVETRIDQLRLSLERLRWVRGDRAERFIAANIAGYRVFFVNDNELIWTSRAMVGKAYRQTPVFRGTLSYLEINPTWTVPPTILKQDVLPAIKRDPAYLQTRNMSVIDRQGRKVDPATIDWTSLEGGFPYAIRQEPGPKNALGEIKFIFPNEHAVFLHDTPNRSLFARPERAFSSGCIRVENPFALAELILNDPAQWDQAALLKVRDSRARERVKTPKLPVLILYLTASVQADGQARFLKDVYARDAAVLAALNGKVVITPL
jgi:murein L,D-transpeptidase YcbB/YkuD